MHAVMDELGHSNPYKVVWQSQVGPSPWLGPQTNASIRGLAGKGWKNIALVPIAFTSDHIETLHELDKEYIEEAQQVTKLYEQISFGPSADFLQEGLMGVKRVDSLNDNPVFLDATADLVKRHLQGEDKTSKQMFLRCPGCVSQKCHATKEYFKSQPASVI